MEHSLIYISTADHLMSENELLSILEQSRAWNKNHGITGMLIYLQGIFLNPESPARDPQTTGRFMQVLEGSAKDVEFIFSAIQADPRHHSIIVLQNLPLPSRDFESWHMGFTSLTTADFNAHTAYFDIAQSGIPTGNQTSTNLPLTFMKSFYQRSLSESTIFSAQLNN